MTQSLEMPSAQHKDHAPHTALYAFLNFRTSYICGTMPTREAARGEEVLTPIERAPLLDVLRLSSEQSAKFVMNLVPLTIPTDRHAEWCRESLCTTLKYSPDSAETSRTKSTRSVLDQTPETHLCRRSAARRCCAAARRPSAAAAAADGVTWVSDRPHNARLRPLCAG